MLPLHKILCSTDFSEASYAALDVAGEWAMHFGAALWVLHAVPFLDHPGLEVDAAEIERALQTHTAEQLQRVIEERLPCLGLVHPLMALGSAADEIASAAWQERVDLLVMATHGATRTRYIACGNGMERIPFGSVNSNVLRLAHCPVLTVRIPPDAADA